MKIILKTSYPCLIKTNTEYLELEENDTLEIQDETMLFVYPQNHSQFPFYINLNNLKENQFYSLLNINNEKVLFLETNPSLQVIQKESLNFSGKNCQIMVSNQEVIFETDNKKLNFKCPHSCKNYKVFKIKDYACIKFDNDLYAYCMNKNKLLHFSGDEINIKDDEIFLLKKFNDSLGREKKVTYKVESDINVEKEEFMYNNKPNDSIDLLPYKLLESVKAKDYSFVMANLSEKLKSEISDEQLKSFFGNVSAFLPLSSTEFITISNHQKNFVKFHMTGEKIDDILIDGL